MIPLKQMEHEHAKRALKLVILLLAHVIDLLGDRHGIDFGEPASAQEFGLTARPRVKIGPFAAGRFASSRTAVLAMASLPFRLS